MKRLPPIIQAIRPNQWIKNATLFAAIVFNGKLFDPEFFLLTLAGFFIFCALSSASYLFNDIIDLKHDKLHPVKKNRPLAAGKISLHTALETAFLLALFGLISALFLSVSFFFVSATFIGLHLFYTTFLKKHAILDILGIAFSFILRTFAGEMLTGFHLPFWLFLTILFIALFIAATKRHAELLREGTKSRPALFEYRERLLDFYTSMFGTASILTYSLFAFFEGPPQFNAYFHQFLIDVVPLAVDRKWMIITIPFVIYGLMRYAKIAYEGSQAEQPEKIVTTDIPLIADIIVWGLTIITILYIL